MIPQFSSEQVAESFRSVAEKLDQRMDAYLFGGGAMARMGAKFATRDVDISLRTEPERGAFGSALERVGAKRQPISAKPNPGSRIFWITPDQMGWDLFVTDVMGFQLTDADYSTSELWLESGNLSVHCIPGSVIFVMKAFTPRTRDLEDMLRLLRHGSANIEEVTGIVRNRLGDDPYQPWLAYFYASVGELGERHALDVSWADEFGDAAEAALVSTQVLNALNDGRLLEEALSARLDVPPDEIGAALLSLQRHGWVDVAPEGWGLTDKRRG